MVNEDKIKALAVKVDKLIADNKKLRGGLKKALDEKDHSQTQRRYCEQRIKELEQRVKVLEATGSMMGSREDNRTARLRVNRLIKEIDTCIAMINKW